jgi:hypothetical protein
MDSNQYTRQADLARQGKLCYLCREKKPVMCDDCGAVCAGCAIQYMNIRLKYDTEGGYHLVKK